MGKALVGRDWGRRKGVRKGFQEMIVELCIMMYEFPGKQRPKVCMELGELKVI